jgi:hypothetical protein
MRPLYKILFAIVAIWPSGLLAQRIGLRLEVRDAANNAVAGANVLTNDASTTSLRGVTDDLGALSFRVIRGTRLSISIRKVGFAPVDLTGAYTADTTLRVIMTRITRDLDTVHVLAEQTARQRAYHIGASDIASHQRELINGFDIIAKLRPDIAWGRGACGGAANIWVNGRWIAPEFVATNDIANARANRGNAEGKVSRTVLYVLSEIKPEHIEEMTYHDCLEQNVVGNHGEAALFETLKVGVRFDPGRGSYLSKR